jgi:hypothetical protein
MRWYGFPVFMVPSLAWETISNGWVSCCVDLQQGLVVAVGGMAPLAPPICMGNCRSFSADCPVPKYPVRVICCIPEAVSKARLPSFSIIMGVVHFIPSARLMAVIRNLILAPRTIEGKGRFRTVAPDSHLLQLAGGSLGLFLYRYLDGIIIIIIIIIIVVVIIIQNLIV